MKSTFKSFYKPQGNELKELWEDAIFVFDTNILTNLYRYQSETSTDFLDILNKIQDKIWIPHHVALEYQRNRLLVIEEQHKKFAETKKTINSMVNELQQNLDHLQLRNRHSHIDPDPLIKGIESLKDNFFQNLDQLEKSSIQISSKDDIREKLDNLFEGKIGKAPTQDEIDQQEKDGEARFNLKIPPGYEDQNKDGSFSFKGVRYQNKFGDFFIWKQIIEHSNAFDIEHLIFVTDDTKKDWWEIVKGKKVGLRTELIDEIYSQSKVKLINVYQAHTFLKHASKHLKTQTSDNSIQDVKLVSESKKMTLQEIRQRIKLMKTSELPEEIIQNMELMKTSELSEEMRQRMEFMKTGGLTEEMRQRIELMKAGGLTEEMRQRMELMKAGGLTEEMRQRMEFMKTGGLTEEMRQRMEFMKTGGLTEEMIQRMEFMKAGRLTEEMIQRMELDRDTLDEDIE